MRPQSSYMWAHSTWTISCLQGPNQFRDAKVPCEYLQMLAYGNWMFYSGCPETGQCIVGLTVTVDLGSAEIIWLFGRRGKQCLQPWRRFSRSLLEGRYCLIKVQNAKMACQHKRPLTQNTPAHESTPPHESGIPPMCFATSGCSCVRSSMRFLKLWLQIALEWLHECCMGYVVGRKPEHETLCFSV